MSTSALSHLATGLLMAMLFWATWYVLSLPIVHWSNSTGSCVRVERAGLGQGCGNLPRKYHSIMVR